MKIGLVLDDTLDTPDGVQQYVLTAGGWLSDQGHEVHYLVGQTVRTDVANIHSLSRNIRVNFNGNHLSVPLPARKRRLRSLLESQQFDLLHVQTPYSPFLAGRLIRLLPASTGLVGTFHVLPYTASVRWANRALALINRRTARRFDAMVADSEPAGAFAAATYGFRPMVIPNPFPLRQFTAEPPRASLPTVVFLGRLVERKGAQHLLEAISYMKGHALYSGDFRVLIGGKGSLLPKLQAFAWAHGLTAQVSFTGFVAEADKAEFLSAADIAVFPSTSGESFGISLLEAMAAARGVVLGGDNPGYRSVLAPLSEDRLVQPSATAQFAAQLAGWLADASARQVAATEQKRYVQQFDIGVVGQQLLEVYAKALQTRTKS